MVLVDRIKKYGSTIPYFAIFIPIAIVTNLVANNLTRGGEVLAGLLLIGIVAAAAIVVLLFFKTVLRSWTTGGAAACAALTLFLTYTNHSIFLTRAFGGRARFVTPFMLLLMFVSCVALFYFIRRIRAEKITIAALNGFSLIFILLAILMMPISATQYANAAGKKIILNELPANPSEGPNIYYFIFDTMLSLETAQKYFGVDPGDFNQTMEDMGFTIIRNAGFEGMRLTVPSFASMFSPDLYDSAFSFIMEEFREAAYRPDANFVDTQNLFYQRYLNVFIEGYNNPQFVRELKNHGYVTILRPGNKYSDPPNYYDIFYPRGVLDNFFNDIFRVFYAATPIDDIWRIFTGVRLSSLAIGDIEASRLSYVYKPYTEQPAIFAEDVIDIISLDTGPKYALMHIILPHYPFAFEEAGSINLSKESFHIKRYKGQYEYTLRYITGIMRQVLEKDPEAVIVIQGDHGITENYLDMSGFDFDKLSHKAIGSDVFLAVYVPGGRGLEAWDNMTALNIPRMIMNEYFGGGFKLLPDNPPLP